FRFVILVFLFFFQAEDGIRDYKVTGVSDVCSSDLERESAPDIDTRVVTHVRDACRRLAAGSAGLRRDEEADPCFLRPSGQRGNRSEERRVGKEWRERGG